RAGRRGSAAERRRCPRRPIPERRTTPRPVPGTAGGLHPSGPPVSWKTAGSLARTPARIPPAPGPPSAISIGREYRGASGDDLVGSDPPIGGSAPRPLPPTDPRAVPGGLRPALPLRHPGPGGGAPTVAALGRRGAHLDPRPFLPGCGPGDDLGLAHRNLVRPGALLGAAGPLAPPPWRGGAGPRL